MFKEFNPFQYLKSKPSPRRACFLLIQNFSCYKSYIELWISYQFFLEQSGRLLTIAFLEGSIKIQPLSKI